jgi:hypothetical protein
MPPTPANVGLAELHAIWREMGRPPQLPDELLDLISSECYGGQARKQQVRWPLPDEHPYTYDGTWWYAACCRELGTGPARLDAVAEWDGYTPGWYDVTVTIPDDWWHLGLIPMKADDVRTWEWPDEPGRSFDTWASGAELHLALLHGWTAKIRHRLLLRRGQPLDLWAERHVRAGTRQDRDILVETIGKLASRPTAMRHYQVRSQLEVDRLTEAGEIVYEDDLGRDVWLKEEERSPWASDHAHPELAAQVWARARARLARELLKVDRKHVIAIEGDAIVLTRRYGPWERPTAPIGQLRRKAS